MAKKSSHFIYCALCYLSSSYHLPTIFISSVMPSLYLSSVLVRSRFYDFAPSPSRARSHLCPLFMYKKWGSEQAQHPSLPHSLYIKSKDKNHSFYNKSEIKNPPLYLHPKSKKSPSFHLLLRHKSLPSLVIIEDANLGNFPFRFVSYFDSRLRIIIWCTINTLSSLKQSAIILWGRRGT